MRSKRILSLILGAIIASGGISQTAMQVYADTPGPSYSERESSKVPELTKLLSIKGTKLEQILKDTKQNINLENLYVSESGFIFTPTENSEVTLVCYDGKQKTVDVPQNVKIAGERYTVTTIGSYAFFNCTELKLTKLPASLTSIGYQAFYGCTGLKLTELPANLTDIGKSAFYGCTGLKLTELPANLTSIGNAVFGSCRNLKLTELPANLTSIGNYAFYDCTGLKLKKLPENLTYIEEGAFEGCTGLKLTELPANLTDIGKNAFSGCANLQLTELPANLTEIGEYAFKGTNIKRITIPASVTVLGEKAFETYKLKEITLLAGTRLTLDKVKRACRLSPDRVTINVPKLERKTINRSDQLVGQDVECTCSICLEKIINEDSKEPVEVVEFPCTEKVHHYMHLGCFNDCYSFRRNELNELRQQQANTGYPRQIDNTLSCSLCNHKYDIQSLNIIL